LQAEWGSRILGSQLVVGDDALGEISVTGSGFAFARRFGKAGEVVNPA